MKILITGVAGFIGFNLAKHLLEIDKKVKIIGIDILNNYYSIKLKKSRLNNLRGKKFTFLKIDICNKKILDKVFKKHKPDVVINLAAQAGVRYSVEHPGKYIDANVVGYFNILDLSKKYKIKKILYASSSSVYGENKVFPLSEKTIINPKNIYALTKKFDEEVSEIYSNFYNMKIVGLRFFTVYGEWGRPDMFFFKYLFASKFKKIFYLNNYGNHTRDFTYVGDVVKIIYKLIKKDTKKMHDIFNISSNTPVKLKEVIKQLNRYVKKPSIIKRKFQRADVIKTHGDNKKITLFTKYYKFEKIENGIKKTALWFLNNSKIFK
tara:strand:+ start:2050 stop:3012 length:963 start_codon:yes stop_codon:yes gene_type:complete